MWRLLMRAGVTSVSIVVALLLCELAVRIIAPQQLTVLRPELYRPDNVFGWRHQENAQTWLNIGERPVLVRTDGNGYRIASNARGTEGPASRVLMLGDSFLEATAVEAEETVSEVLAQRLSQSLHRSVAVDNSGVGGWNPNHYLLEAKRALARDRYDLGIVLLYVGNDLVTATAGSYPAAQPIQTFHFRLPHELTATDVAMALLYPVNDLLETRSHLFVLAKQRLDIPLARLGLTKAYFPDVFRIDDQASTRWETTAAICRSIQQVFAAHHAPAIFVLVPTSYQVEAETFRTYVKSFQIRPDTVDLDQPNRILANRFREAGLTLVDPLVQFRQQSRVGALLYGRADRHLSANGHAALATQLVAPAEAALKN